MTLQLTFKWKNLLLPPFFVLYIHYSGAGSSSWPYPKSMMLCHWLERKTGSLPTAIISKNEPRSYNFAVCRSDSLTYHKSLSRFNQVLSDASAPGWNQLMKYHTSQHYAWSLYRIKARIPDCTVSTPPEAIFHSILLNVVQTGYMRCSVLK